jgi:hypothetical protein
VAVIVVEDGTGLADSNSYGSYAGYVAYWTDRGAVPAEDQDVIEAALIKATDYLGIRFTWKGEKLTAAQALDWPRACAYGMPSADYPCGVPLEGVPVELEKATYEYAKRALVGELAPDPTVSATGVTVVASTRKVGPIEVSDEFSGSSASSTTFKPFPAADGLLRWLVVTSSGRVWRA